MAKKIAATKKTKVKASKTKAKTAPSVKVTKTAPSVKVTKTGLKGFDDAKRFKNLIPTQRNGTRRITVGRNDDVTKAMNKAQLPSEVAAIGSKSGLTMKELTHRAKNASNFGQFRMVVGNRVRGVISKVRTAKKAGKELTYEQAAAKGCGRKYI